jgi:hypothetical protein
MWSYLHSGLLSLGKEHLVRWVEPRAILVVWEKREISGLGGRVGRAIPLPYEHSAQPIRYAEKEKL